MPLMNSKSISTVTGRDYVGNIQTLGDSHSFWFPSFHLMAMACATSQPPEVVEREVVKEVPVEVLKEVPVEVVKEVEVIREKPVEIEVVRERPVEVEVVREVEVVKERPVEVIREGEVVATPTPMPAPESLEPYVIGAMDAVSGMVPRKLRNGDCSSQANGR